MPYQLFQQALGIDENDLKSRVQTLSLIGAQYDASDKPEQKREAVKYYRLAAAAARQAGDKLRNSIHSSTPESRQLE